MIKMLKNTKLNQTLNDFFTYCKNTITIITIITNKQMKEIKKIITLLRDFANFSKPKLIWFMNKTQPQVNPETKPVFLYEVILSSVIGALLTDLTPMYVFDRLGFNGFYGYFGRYLIFFYISWLNLGNFDMDRSYSKHANTFAVIFYKLFMAASIVSVFDLFYPDTVESVFWYLLGSTIVQIFYIYTPDKKEENNG